MASSTPSVEFRRLRGCIKHALADVADSFAAGGPVEAFQAAHARLADDVITGVLHIARCKFIGKSQTLLPLAAVAIGGYGRRQLAPASDLDLLFLLPDAGMDRSTTERMVTFAIPALWDLGFRVDHFTLSPGEYPGLPVCDLKMKSGYLDARLVWGSTELHYAFRNVWASVTAEAKQTISGQLLEESGCRDKVGHSHSAQEPNLKCGPGGLRDIQCLNWLASLHHGAFPLEPRTITAVSRAEAFLSRCRCNLHLLTGRPEERLRQSLQPAIAERLGLSATRLLDVVNSHAGVVRDALMRASGALQH